MRIKDLRNRASKAINTIKHKWNCLKSYAMGEDVQWTEGYEKIYGPGKYESLVDASKEKTLGKYKLVLFMGVVLLIFTVVQAVLPDYPQLQVDSGVPISIERPTDGRELKIELEVGLRNGGASRQEDVILHIDPQMDGGDESEGKLPENIEKNDLRQQLDDAIRAVEDNPARYEINLPTILDDGTRVNWSLPAKSQNAVLFLIVPLLFVWIYRGRFDPLKTLEKDSKESIISELPEFINKLVLLMNSGLVFYSAFERIITEVEGSPSGREYFYEQLMKLHERNNTTHSTFGKELTAFSKRTGVKEFIRITNIINDNISKGSELTEKLEAENNMLWFARKKQAEEKGRLAETKMTIPLVILLMVLILVTVAPAMLEM